MKARTFPLFLSETTFFPDSIGKDIVLIVTDDKAITLDQKEPLINYESEQIIVDKEEIISKEKIASFNQLFIPHGNQSTLTFSDGSVAYVNAGSRLVYPVEFGKDKREIFVDGEVYLDITPDKNRPFIVKTSELDVTVLGTKLNVHTYESEKQKNVTLVSGSVRISSPGKKDFILKPNEMYTLEDGQPAIETVNAYDKIAWINGIYIFRGTSLDTIIHTLEKYYGVKIDYD
ncbi:MAG: FecR domain-containing protein, partial [Tannerellaceae bacterium]|nr:FecR domain-containing protein [Tannerellaceae bacterium]